MKIWKHSRRDALLLTYSVAQLAGMILVAFWWTSFPLAAQVATGLVLAALIAYHIIVVSHLFTHVPWFVSAWLNAVASVLNSIDIGQSVQAYHLTHVRNHHRFNNDARGEDGTTRDASSTYRDGENGEHDRLAHYVLVGAWQSLVDRAHELTFVTRLWRVGPGETRLLGLASNRPGRRAAELRQLQADRIANSLALVGFAVISWQWTLLCYLPAYFVSLAMVNVQNYYRHYGANPAERAADSVSYYGKLYNWLAFNDGYHQEHHLSPATHWSKMPEIRQRHQARLAARPRVISSVPAMLGFLDRDRPLLHRGDRAGVS